MSSLKDLYRKFLQNRGKPVDTVGYWGGAICMVQLVPLIGAIFPTESALRRTFDKDGKRINK